MAETQSHSARVWKGDEMTVVEAREQYKEDPDKGLLPYAVALYSFRHKKQYAKELVGLADELVNQIYHEVSELNKNTDYNYIHRYADTVSTHLEWISRQRGIGLTQWHTIRSMAFNLNQRGIYIARIANDEQNGHTLPLLYLTQARLQLSIGAVGPASKCIAQAIESSREISDPNQRARVYRKIGMLCRMTDMPLNGVVWGVKSIFVPGSTLAVRAKSVAALFGLGD